MSSLADLLVEEALCPAITAASAAEAIETLAGILQSQGRVLPSYAGAVVEREATMPTGLPLGAINVAIPHTDAEHVTQASVAVATLTGPVAFGSMDDPDEQLDVRIVFLLALRDKHAQLEMLQQIASLIQETGRLETLLAANDRTAMRAALQ